MNKIKKFWWVIPLVLFDLCYYYFILFFIEKRGSVSIEEFRLDGVSFLIFISLFSVFLVYTVKRMTSKRTTLKLPIKYAFVILISTIIFLAIVFGFQYVIELSLNQQRSLGFYLNSTIIIGFLHLVVANAAAGVSYYQETLKLQMEIEGRDRKQSEMELQILRQQMSPHFLFNNLNTLSSLIGQDDRIAKEFTQRLAKLYRYTTQVAREDLVKLAEELDFVENYLRLAVLRFGDIYDLKMNLKEKDLANGLVIPMSLQTVLENVLKHNYGTKEVPLKVEISLEKQTLTVVNEIRLKPGVSGTLGVGLKNLQEQYQLVSGQTLYYGNRGGQFVVDLPIIN